MHDSCLAIERKKYSTCVLHTALDIPIEKSCLIAENGYTCLHCQKFFAVSVGESPPRTRHDVASGEYRECFEQLKFQSAEKSRHRVGLLSSGDAGGTAVSDSLHRHSSCRDITEYSAACDQCSFA